MEPTTIRLDELGIDEDPGTSWHPRPDKVEARDELGDLRDLDDDEAIEHQAKPEAAEQLDAGVVLAAEDSEHTPPGEV